MAYRLPFRWQITNHENVPFLSFLEADLYVPLITPKDQRLGIRGPGAVEQVIQVPVATRVDEVAARASEAIRLDFDLGVNAVSGVTRCIRIVPLLTEFTA